MYIRETAKGGNAETISIGRKGGFRKTVSYALNMSKESEKGIGPAN